MITRFAFPMICDKPPNITEQAASTLEPYVRDPVGLSALGMLTLTASLAAASLQQGDMASHWLDEARGIAARVPDEPERNWQSFSVTNVGIWRATTTEELHQALESLPLFPYLDIEVIPLSQHPNDPLR